MVRIAHISDSHLGSSMFQLVERREDARKCLEKTIELAMQKSPDIIVHTGDLFHESLPQNDDRNFVIKQFKKLKDKVGLDEQRRRWLPDAIAGLDIVKQIIVVTHMQELKGSTHQLIELIPQGKGRQPIVETQ